MNGNDKVLLDSDVLVNYSKGFINLDDYFERYNSVCISVITYMEIFGYNFINSREEKLLKDIINKIEIVNINEIIVEKVIEIRKNFKIKIPDSIIFATASFLNANFVSFNERDFLKLRKA